MQLAIADELSQLVGHVLAHVPLAGPGNLWDPRYVAWARAQTSREDQALLEHDAALLARLWDMDPRLDALHGLFDLHTGLEGLRATAARPLAGLRGDEVADAALLDELRGLDAAELVHASLGVLVGSFSRVLEACADELARARVDVDPWLRRVAACVPELDATRVELVFALGQHGRALPRRILIGAPATWNGIDPAWPAVVAGHEALVLASGYSGYVECERWALAELRERMRSADAELRAAHAAWLASLDLSGL